MSQARVRLRIFAAAVLAVAAGAAAVLTRVEGVPAAPTLVLFGALVLSGELRAEDGPKVSLGSPGRGDLQSDEGTRQ